MQNCIDGLKTVIGLAETKKVNLCIEPLNTRVDVEMKGHPGYQCDTIEWGVKVCEGVGSSRMKILFDIYHTQIMQGDVIVRLRQYKDFIGHIHTAGVPGRNELDDTQEINYPAVMKTIADIGYTGFVGQEFIPTWKDKLAALRHAAKLCDV
jgi:hydroxypyruvate isomerase